MEPGWVWNETNKYKQSDLKVIIQKYTNILEQDIRFIIDKRKRKKCMILLCDKFPMSLLHYAIQLEVKNLYSIKVRSVGLDELARVGCEYFI